jgi:hypothetical protein
MSYLGQIADVDPGLHGLHYSGVQEHCRQLYAVLASSARGDVVLRFQRLGQVCRSPRMGVTSTMFSSSILLYQYK